MKSLNTCALCAIASLMWAGTVQAHIPESQPTNLSDTSPLVVEGIVAAPVAEMWKVFTTAEGYKALGVAQAKMDFRPGGLLITSYDPASSLEGDTGIQTQIVAFEPQRMIVTRIHQPPKGFPFKEAYKRVWTIITLTDLGDERTSVRIAMVGYGEDEESQEMRRFFASGNQWVMKMLQSKYVPRKAPQGPPHSASPLGVIDLKCLVHAPQEDVWKMLTTGEGWKKFFKVDAKIGSMPGQAFEPFPGTDGCKLLAIVPGEMFSFTWNAPSRFVFAAEHPTWVVANIESVSPAVTRLRLRHFGFAEQAASYPDHSEEFEQVRAYFSAEWPKLLGRLTAHFELK